MRLDGDWMHLVTGYAGKEHVTAADQGALQAAIISTGKRVLPVDEQFAHTVVSNNILQIGSGAALINGRYARIPYGQTERIMVDGCPQGYYRSDIIAIRYTKNEDTYVEKAELVVLKGSPRDSVGGVLLPDVVEGDILKGALICEYPLYSVNISGAAGIVAVKKIFSVAENIEGMAAKLANKKDCVRLLWSGYLQGNTVSGTAETFSVPEECFFDNGKQLILIVNGYCPKEEANPYIIQQIGMCFGDATDFGTDDEHIPYEYGEGEKTIYVKETANTGHTINATIQVVKVPDDRYATCRFNNKSPYFCVTSISAVVPV